jgi:hypothetical protein
MRYRKLLTPAIKKKSSATRLMLAYISGVPDYFMNFSGKRLSHDMSVT